VQWAHAVAPGAKILLVEAKTANIHDLFAGVDVASATPGVSVVSMSWGGSEFSTEATFDHHFTEHPAITYLASTGDHGASPFLTYPAVSTDVVSVGGTQLITDNSGNYKSETPWTDAGGGASIYIAEPAFQTSANINNTGGMRGSPDLVFPASPNP